MKEKENSDKENRKDEDDVDMDDILVGFLKYRLLPSKKFHRKIKQFLLRKLSKSTLQSHKLEWRYEMIILPSKNWRYIFTKNSFGTCVINY